jgi:hypothetical protein
MCTWSWMICLTSSIPQIKKPRILSHYHPRFALQLAQCSRCSGEASIHRMGVHSTLKMYLFSNFLIYLLYDVTYVWVNIYILSHLPKLISSVHSYIYSSTHATSDSNFQSYQANTTTKSTKSELRNYLEEPLEDPNPMSFLLEWWQVKSLRYPVSATTMKRF